MRKLCCRAIMPRHYWHCYCAWQKLWVKRKYNTGIYSWNISFLFLEDRAHSTLHAIGPSPTKWRQVAALTVLICNAFFLFHFLLLFFGSESVSMFFCIHSNSKSMVKNGLNEISNRLFWIYLMHTHTEFSCRQ